MKDLSNYDWYCDNCDASLDEQTGFNVNCGSWICTECGDINFIEESEIIEDDYDDYDDEIPEGCAACGGPYPNCMTSCPIFDD